MYVIEMSIININFFTELAVDHCDPNPCLNGGICTSGMDSFTCSCQGDFTGERCETSKFIWIFLISHGIKSLITVGKFR